MKNKKNVYWVLSGDGENGTWKRVIVTERGLKLLLTKERCGGDRWAYAYTADHINYYDQVIGSLVFAPYGSGNYKILPVEAKSDIEH